MAQRTSPVDANASECRRPATMSTTDTSGTAPTVDRRQPRKEERRTRMCGCIWLHGMCAAGREEVRGRACEE